MRHLLLFQHIPDRSDCLILTLIFPAESRMNTLLSLEHLQIVRIVIEPVVLSGVGQSGSTGLENAHLILLNNPMQVLAL